MDSTPATQPTPKRHGARRALIWSAAALALLLLFIAGLALVTLQTEWGARVLWQNAPRFLPGELSGELVGGTLKDGLTLRNVEYADQTKRVKVDRLEAKWGLSRSPLKLTIPYLRVGTADVTMLPSPDEPTTMPQEIKLPLALDLQSATVDKVIIRSEGEPATYSDISLQASSDRINHAVQLRKAVTPFGTVAAALKLNGNRPFNIDGTARIDGAYQDRQFNASADLAGSLEALGVQVRAAAKEFNAQAQIDATPFADVPFRSANIRADKFDPSAINPEWPKALMQITAQLAPVNASTDMSKLVVSGPVTITNSQAGPIDKGMLPLESVHATVTLDAQTQRLAQARIELPGKAVLEGGGELRSGGKGEFKLDASALDLHALHTAVRPTKLKGPLSVQLDGETQIVNLTLTDPDLSITADAKLTPERMTLSSAKLKAGPAKLDVSGGMARGASSDYAFQGSLSDFDPARFLATMQVPGTPKKKSPLDGIDADINMDFKAEGVLQPEISARVQFNVNESTYADLPMTGGGLVHLVGKRILPSDARLTIAGNNVDLKGSFGQPSDRLKVNIDAPALARLGFGLNGLLRVNGEVAGTIDRPLVDARYEAENLVFGNHRLASLSGMADIDGVPGSDPNAKVDLTLNARGLQSGEIRLTTVSADIDGTYGKHTISVDAKGQLRDQKLDVGLDAQGNLRETRQGLAWDGVLRTLENRGVPRVSMRSPLAVSVAPGRVDLGNTRFDIARAVVDLKSFQFNNQLVKSEGSFNELNIGHLLALRRQFTGEAPPVDTNLILDGQWNVTLADRADGFVRIDRSSGDIGISGPAGNSLLGLNALSLTANLQGNRVVVDAGANATRIGRLDGKGEIMLQSENGRVSLTPDAPVSGRVNVTIPRLQSIASLAGPRIALNGTVAIDLAANGTLSEPKLSGTVLGDDLALTLFDQGVRLRDGTARIILDNNIIELQQVQFQGGNGTLRATGRIPLDQSRTDISATVVADNLQLLASPAGQLTVSGQAKAANVNNQLVVGGNFVVDRALFSLPEQAAPKLDDDVIVIRGNESPAKAASKPGGPDNKPAGPFTPRVDIAVDLGNQFRFEGSGAELRLAGSLNIRSAPAEPIQAFGTVRIVDGTYEAFGAELAIERGLLNFQGPLANPNVNILAMRREQEVEAGVRVTGTVQQPRVELVSEPNVSEEEKLSWLIFGRAGGNSEPGQAQNAAKGAALGLLNKFGGQRIASRFGLDEFSIGSSDFGLQGQQVVNLGKEITDNLFIGFEQSLAGTGSVLKLTYELTQNWSVVVRGGAVTGMDMLYNKRFDKLRGG
ncbi:MAG TPA: translocation/assembly module TamB domain-containing protein [Noviherbaspirillum sp.]|jgi:translocation and assembly module TamB|uniref:translocation/assembly module TamB domain-containing protein n=1 Tax=Noviherbaspirillum sp. TaxID=1926288 RepID=UPI002DDD2309|nr:translocation/assembly module TamB domain-containing protein [Noviherbaspirillum sp.]HEV2610868.1 translocation/assembly module TamB domain-containing protein [Noviherbaspirillum sp.]